MTCEDISPYVVRDPKSGRFRYYRRVPREVMHFDKRQHVKQSLKTRNHREALKRAEEVHRATEAYLRALAVGATESGLTLFAILIAFSNICPDKEFVNVGGTILENDGESCASPSSTCFGFAFGR